MTKNEIGSHAHRVLLVSRHVLRTVEETQFINYSKDKIVATFVLEYNGKMRVVGLGTGMHETEYLMYFLNKHA